MLAPTEPASPPASLDTTLHLYARICALSSRYVTPLQVSCTFKGQMYCNVTPAVKTVALLCCSHSSMLAGFNCQFHDRVEGCCSKSLAAVMLYCFDSNNLQIYMSRQSAHWNFCNLKALTLKCRVNPTTINFWRSKLSGPATLQRTPTLDRPMLAFVWPGPDCAANRSLHRYAVVSMSA